MDAELFADLDFDGQAVRVPAGFAFAAVAAHRAVAREQVLDRAGEAVARVRHAVGRRRAFVEHERRRHGPLLQRLFIDALFLPELADLQFLFGKVRVAFDGLEHSAIVGQAVPDETSWRLPASVRHSLTYSP